MTDTQDMSKDALTGFLNYMTDKNMLSTATLASRKAAVNTLLGVLGPEEVADVTKVDLDQAAIRLNNKRPNDFRPESLKVYKSRVASAVYDFVNYRKDPVNFKPRLFIAKLPGAAKPPAPKSDAGQGGKPNPPGNTIDTGEITIPIPLRPNLVMKLVGVPSDLTRAEAIRIAAVINAFAVVPPEN